MCCEDILGDVSVPKGCGIINKVKSNSAKCPLLCFHDVFKPLLPLFYGAKDHIQGITQDLKTTHPTALSSFCS